MSQKFLWIGRIAGAVAAFGMLAVAGSAYATVPTLSQTSVTVGAGQSTTVTSQNNIGVYMEMNSTPTVASVSVNGTQVTVSGLAPGTDLITLCAVGTSSDCTSLSVTVQVGNVTGISFSQSAPSLSVGNSQSVTISGGNGTYSISSNSNSGVVSTSLSGNALTISGVAIGSATINVCDTSNACNSLSVTVSSSGSTGLTFSQNNISLMSGGSQVVTISGGNSVYNISSNSNSSAASPSMSSSNAITIFASTPGNASIIICDSANVCGTLAITVTSSSASSNQAVTFSVPNPTLTVGQTLNVGLSGGATNYVILTNTQPNVVQATVNSSVTLAISGLSAGTDSLTICATGGGCSQLLVTVTGTGSANTGTTTAVTTPTPVVPVTTVIAPAGTAVVNAALLAEIQSLQAAVTQALAQIQAIQTQLNQIAAQVSAGGTSNVSASASAGGSYTFTELLTLGSSGSQVSALQQRLVALGFYSGSVTGYYGILTQQAVMKYQSAHGISATGSVGPSTRAALNAGN